MEIHDGGKPKPDKWAILIGIDLYLPGEARGPIKAESLYGCVNDVRKVQEYLVQFQGVEPSRTRKLCAPHGQYDISTFDASSKDVDEIWRLASHIPVESRPTYENMVRVLQETTDEASSGDLVYIHYSGHGSRVVTLIPEIKKGNPFHPDRPGIDEALVPMDTNLGGRYLRDVEMAALLKRMVDKGLHVTLVLDSCHSGGATRSTKHSSETTLRARALLGTDADGVNWGQLFTDRSDIPSAELKTALESQPWSHSTAWLIPNGYALLAAVLPSELSLEIVSMDGTLNGVFTVCLLEALRESDGNVTYADLHRRVKALVQEKLAAEPKNFNRPHRTMTPVLMGNVGRQFFRRDSSAVIHSILVLKMKGTTVLLGGGYAHGVRNGDFYNLYHWSRRDFSHVVAKVRVDKAYGIESDATVLNSSHLAPGETLAGYHAILEKRMIPTVHIQLRPAPSIDDFSDLGLENSWPKITIHDDWQNAHTREGIITLRYCVSMDSMRRYRLQDENSSAVPMLPTFPDTRSLLNAASHVGEFEFFRKLRNEFSDKIKVEFRVQPRENCHVSSDMVEIRHGQPMKLHFENKTSSRVYLTVFAMTSLWGILKIYPLRNDAEYDEIEWAHHRDIEILPEFPMGLSSEPFVSETLKAFITTKPTSFNMLEMEELIEGSMRGQMVQHEVSPMQGRLLQTLATFDSPLEGVQSHMSARDVPNERARIRPMRAVEPQSGNGEEWQTREIAVRIYRTEKWPYE